MTSVLLASTPVRGHVTPLLSVAASLIAAGDRVRFLTGARYREEVLATGRAAAGRMGDLLAELAAGA